MAQLEASTHTTIALDLARPKPKARGSPLVDKLPEDVLFMIVNDLDMMGRARLLRTCRCLHSLLERIQYRDIDMTDPWRASRTDLLHRTLSKRPDLISCIISYRGPLMSANTRRAKLQASPGLRLLVQGKQTPITPPGGTLPTEDGVFWVAMFIFSQAVKLRGLESADWIPDPERLEELVKVIVPKMSLTLFSLPINAKAMELAPLLRGQPELELLGLPSVAGGLRDLKETDIPKLKSLKATLKDATIIVPATTNPSSSFTIMLEAHKLFTLVSDLVCPKSKVRDPPRADQRFSKLVQLPEDILFMVANDLDMMGRARLRRTCRYLHSLLERIQYRHLDMTDPWLYYHTDLLHRTLSQRPDLISYMISYRGYLISPGTRRTELKTSQKFTLLLQRKHKPPSTTPGGIPLAEDDPFGIAIFTLSKAVNLRELESVDWVPNAERLEELVRVILPNMSLTRFSLPKNGKSMELVPLLRGQPELEHLGLPCSAGSFGDLKETDMPKLKSLKATLKDAAVIVPSRPVAEFYHLFEVGEQTLDEQLVQTLSLSSSSIRKLTTRLHNPRLPESTRIELQVLARHLPTIEDLTITVNGLISEQIVSDSSVPRRSALN
ncbi:hypothetical protein FRC01_004176 [Tulasnella sp. 417]|nr:hypothetical protein FRC01_004176 [Tulasnella sp. 417]